MISSAPDRQAGFPGIAGRKVLVTGASSGLGCHFARLFAARDAHVIAAARRVDRVESLCRDIEAAGGHAQAAGLDVTAPGSVAELLERHQPDIVINNAGTTVSAPAIDHSAAEVDAILDTNIKGVFNVARQAAVHMKAGGQGGSIVNIASILGHRVAGHAAVYAASKGAVLQLTRALALEWARHGIRVNALCPGYIETDLNRDFFATEQGQMLIRRIPQRRLGQPGDLDGAVLLLASDLGRFITGADIVVDGGHLVSSL